MFIVPSYSLDASPLFGSLTLDASAAHQLTLWTAYFQQVHCPSGHGSRKQFPRKVFPFSN
jgi:hypothetical protein